jgi:GAF domain-containing protein
MVIEDALQDPRFHDNPLVTGDPNIRFYAGAPVVIEGQALGTLCVIDTRPRTLGDEDIRVLEAVRDKLVTEIRDRAAAGKS